MDITAWTCWALIIKSTHSWNNFNEVKEVKPLQKLVAIRDSQNPWFSKKQGSGKREGVNPRERDQGKQGFFTV
ncbi:CLUMA_CG017360, isoform A [Clunio marinus]|uniref:CLUMA_CG017360, isoform A n=1 Tax=Clunio marinus TaxID=568069 RepID=A0A1J1IVM0_9DIPT|nr:CLUMA_CG017360, isoform A [Clunio marinus]